MGLFFPKTIEYKMIYGAYSNGIWSDSYTIAYLKGSAQPLTSEEIRALNVGRLDAGKIKVYTLTDLKVSKQGTGESGDFISWEGSEWEVIQKDTCKNGILEHFKYICEYRKQIT